MSSSSKQQPERRHRDTDQDQNRDQRPGHFDRRVVGGPRGYRIGPRVELQHHRDQQRQHKQRDHRDDDQQTIVKPNDAVHHRRRRRLQVQLPRCRLPNHFFRKRRATRQQQNPTPPPIPATAAQSVPSTSSCRSRSPCQNPEPAPGGHRHGPYKRATTSRFLKQVYFTLLKMQASILLLCGNNAPAVGRRRPIATPMTSSSLPSMVSRKCSRRRSVGRSTS